MQRADVHYESILTLLHTEGLYGGVCGRWGVDDGVFTSNYSQPSRTQL